MINSNSVESIEFCRFSNLEISYIETILNQSFYIQDFDKIINSYNHFSKDFETNDFEKLDLLTIEREKIIPRTTQVELIEKFKQKKFTIGIDLPTLLRPVKNNGKNIFIIAEDALRTNQTNDNVILSTPFGTHIKKFRETKLKNYWGVIENILKDGYSVYLTDALKFWIKQENENKINLKGDVLSLFQLTLLREINLFNPSMIITFGNTARNFVAELHAENKINNIEIIKFPHPTPTANGAWKEILSPNNCSAVNKVSHMNSKIDTAMLQLS